MAGLSDILNGYSSHANSNSYVNLLAQSAGRAQEQMAASIFNSLFNSYGASMSTPGMSHVGAVKDFRKRFKQYTKEEFRKISNKPLVKDILSGMTKLNKEQIKDRIAEHLATV